MSKLVWGGAAAALDPETVAADPRTHLAEDHREIVSAVTNIPSVVLMLQLSRSIPQALFPFDSITFAHSEMTSAPGQDNEGTSDGHDSIIGWIARDSSKPGRYNINRCAVRSMIVRVFYALTFLL